MRDLNIRVTRRDCVCIVHIFLALFILLILWAFSGQLSLPLLQWIVIALFIENCTLSLLGDFFNLYQIFLGTSFLFIYVRIFLDAIGFCDFRRLDYLEIGYMTESVAGMTLMVLTVFLLGTSVAWVVYLRYKDFFIHKSVQYYSHARYSRATHIIQDAYYVLIFLSIIKSIIIIQQVLKNGYLWLFNGGIQSFPFPVFLRVQSLTDLVFSALLFYEREERYVKRNMLLYMIYLSVKILSGQRGQLFVSLLLMMWIYSTYYKKIRVGKVILTGIISFFVIGFIQKVRGDAAITSVYSLLYSQGVSILVVVGTIRFIDVFQNRYPFVLGYIVDYFAGLFNSDLNAGQNMERILHGNYLGDHLTYTLSSSRYLSGGGIGTSMIAEFYELVKGNLVLLFVVCFAFMLVILILSHSLYKNIGCFIAIYFILYRFIYSPRDSVFKSINMIILSIPVVVILKLIERKRLSGIWDSKKREE